MDRWTIIREFITELYQTWSAERPTRQAAALAYYGIFSFAPVVFIVITVAGLFIQELSTTVLPQLYERVVQLFGQDMADFLMDLVTSTTERTSGGSTLTTLVGLGSLLYAATGLFANLKYSLNAIWHVPLQDQAGMVKFALNRLLSFVMVIGLGLLLVVAVFASVVVSILRSFVDWSSYLPLANIVIVFMLMTVIFALIYKILPDTRIDWRDVWIGAIVTAILVLLGGTAVIFYLGKSDVGSAFDAAGSLAVMLIGFYYVATIFLTGAIFTRVFAETFGSRARLGDENSS
ncbi:MAG: YihY/virulence factor BrkB family protein [Chloroflexi bacterium]|nr:YihY/virulence factor BrkB family protein [Chloroflexota bacterium]